MMRPWMLRIACRTSAGSHGKLLAAGLAAALGLGASSAFAASPSAPAYEAGNGDDALLTVSPGEEIGIACSALNVTAPDNDVRVVLTISAPPASPQPGFKKVLATNEEMGHGAVRVRIPQMPDLANSIVKVDVYVISETGARACNAGHMHIANSADPGTHS